jgi:hypothetical protein
MTEDAPVAPTPPNAGLIEDFVDIFASPREVFARRATSGFWTILIILVLVIGGLFLVNRGTMEGIMDAEMQKAMAEAMKKNPTMTAEQFDAGKKIGEKFATFGAFIGVPLVLFCVGLGAWVTAKILGGKMTYQAATMIACYAYIPRILESVGVTIQGLLLDTSAMHGRFQLSLGVGRFMNPDMSPGLLGILGRIDVFTLWVTVLIAIGIVTVAKLPKEKLIPAGAIMWAYGALPALWTLIRNG